MSRTNDCSKSIMLVDDEADICTSLKKALDKDFEVSTFTEASLALEHFKLDPYRCDLVITDVRMPRMSGFELARSIKTISPQTKIVLMTAFEIHKAEFDKVMPRLRVDAFLTKPVSLGKIREVMGDLLYCSI